MGGFILFNVQNKDIDEKMTVHLVQIEGLSKTLREFIDSNLMTICRGENHENELKYIKKQLKNFFKSKDDVKKFGSIGELFSHFYLSSIDYRPKFMFLNLEENSVKKGFDGFYEKSEMIWLLDSKSGKHDSTNISHRSKILEAYRSVKGQLGGRGVSNNPWENAFQHANSRDINSSNSLLKTIRKFSNDYLDEEFADMKTLNLILASTIYWYDAWSGKEIDDLLEELEDVQKNMEYSKLTIFCSNKKTFEEFLEYLEEEEEDYELEREAAADVS